MGPKSTEEFSDLALKKQQVSYPLLPKHAQAEMCFCSWTGHTYTCALDTLTNVGEHSVLLLRRLRACLEENPPWPGPSLPGSLAVMEKFAHNKDQLSWQEIQLDDRKWNTYQFSDILLNGHPNMQGGNIKDFLCMFHLEIPRGNHYRKKFQALWMLLWKMSPLLRLQTSFFLFCILRCPHCTGTG